MRIAIIGRTGMLLDAAVEALALGHEVVYVATFNESSESQATVDDYYAFSKLCGCSFYKGLRFGDAQAIELQKLAPDLGLTMNWPTIIGSEITSAFKFGIINAHGSDLPKYRGNACPNWAIIQGDDKVGLTFHLIDPDGLDTGAVVCKSFFALSDEIYIADVYEWLATAVPSGFAHAMQLIARGSIATAQTGAIVRSYPRTPADGKIDWSHSALNIHRLIRASSKPFPGAFCHFSEHKITVWRAKTIRLANLILAVPGQILWYDNSNPVVACGEGAIELTDFQAEDKSEMPKSLRARFS